MQVETTATIKTGEDSKISNLVISTDKVTDTVKLEGQYDNVEVAKEAKVEIGETAVITDSLKVSAKAEIQADEKADVNKVDIATATNETVKLEGTFAKVEINSESKVEVAADTKIESIVANTNAEINLDKTAVVDNVDKGSNTVAVGGEGTVTTNTSPSTGGTSSNGGGNVPSTAAVTVSSTIVKAESTTINGGEKATAIVSGQSITFDGEIAYYKDGIIPGNWVGVKITAPTNVIPDENAILTVNGKNCNLNENPGWSNIKEDSDGDNFFYLYQMIRDTSKIYEIVVKWNNESTEAYCINFAPTAMLQVYKTDLADIIIGAQKNYNDTAQDIYYGVVTEEARQALLSEIQAAQIVYDNAVNAKTDAVQAGIYTAQDELIAAIDAYWDSYVAEVYSVSDNIAANTTYSPENPLNISIRIEGVGDFVTENTISFMSLDGDLSNMSIKSVTPVLNTYGMATGAKVELTGTTGDSIDHGTISIAAGGINGHSHGFDVVCNAPVISTASGAARGDVDPSIVVTLENDTFTADGTSNLQANWTGSLGTTGLTGGTITRDSDTQMTFHLNGTAKAGVLILKANAAALTRGVDSNTIRITIPEFAAIGVKTDHEAEVVGIRNDADMKRVTVMYPLTVGGLKSAIESTDSLELNYEVRDLDGNVKDDEAVLAQDDTLCVSSQDGLAFGAYMIRVFGTVNIEVVTKQGETTIPVSKPIISMFNENNEPIYFIDGDGNIITETTMGDDGKWEFFINAAKYLYRIKAEGYDTQDGEFIFTLDHNPLTVTVTLSAMNLTTTTIRVKDAEEYQQKVNLIVNDANPKFAIIEYPTTVGELMSSIESTNGWNTNRSENVNCDMDNARRLC